MSAFAWRLDHGAVACAACAVGNSKCCCVRHGVDAAFMIDHAVPTEGISPVPGGPSIWYQSACLPSMLHAGSAVFKIKASSYNISLMLLNS